MVRYDDVNLDKEFQTTQNNHQKRFLLRVILTEFELYQTVFKKGFDVTFIDVIFWN